MKYIRVFLILGFVMQCTAKQKVEQKEVELQNIYNHNLIIYYDREIGKEYLLKSVQNYRAELLYDYDNINGIAIKIPSDKSIREAIRYFQQVKGVLSVNRDEVMQISK